MGCAESSFAAPEEIAKELYQMVLANHTEDVDAVLQEALWRNGRVPDWEYVRLIITSNIETTSKEWKESLLHYSIRFNATSFVELFMNYDPPLTVKNSHGNTVIHTSCVAGSSLEVFELLVKDLPPPPPMPPGSPSASNSPLDAPNEDGDFPLHLASRNHFGWLVEALLVHGAMPTAVNREGDTPLELVRNAHHRNPLSRGNVTVRKRTSKPWWDMRRMDLTYIVELLELGPGNARLPPPLPEGTSGSKRGSGSFEAAVSSDHTGVSSVFERGNGGLLSARLASNLVPATAATSRGSPKSVEDANVCDGQPSLSVTAGNNDSGPFTAVASVAR